MEPRSREIKATIRARALALGFDAVGFAPASLGSAAREDLREFLRRGYHGDMGWLADRADQRAEPRALWPDALSVVVLGLNYGPEFDPLAARAPMNRGEVSVYARGRDYHDVLKSKLRTLARWIAETWSTHLKLFVDTAPVMEKPIAERAGVGWQGKHTNLVSRGFGSWLFLGEIYLALELEPDTAEDDHCGECRRCLDACPTNAFPAPYQLDARRCISYLTIEHEGTIERALRPLIGNRIYGCDDCLAVCPWNKFATAGREARLRASAAAAPLPLGELARLNDAEFRRRFSGSPIKRIGRDRFLRNVLIAIGNCGDKKLSEVVLPLLADHAPLVRAMAVWALRHLASPQEWREAAAERLPTERDAAVRAEWESAD